MAVGRNVPIAIQTYGKIAYFYKMSKASENNKHTNVLYRVRSTLL